jgi:murein L,D-transpeptidase YafK
MKRHCFPFAARGLPALFALLALGCAAVPALAARKASRPDPDLMLIEVYKDLGARHLRDALARADTLVATYPNFQLGHLLRGDLLLMQTHEVNRFGAVDGAAPEALASLRQEASARLKALYERPDPGLVPRAVLQLRRDQKKVLLVDARRSRLYVYENRQGQLRFERDFYISQGKLGVDKAREGDQKTPLGVYYITGRLAGRRLPDLYGVGALPISYPNDWDRLHGRDGSGIWLHGTPARNYSRPPLSSDGCVVLTNPDLRLVYATIQVGKTPVVITREAAFISPGQADQDRRQAQGLVESWRAALQDQEHDPERLRRLYSHRFHGEQDDTLEDWLAGQRKDLERLRSPAIVLRDLSLFRYPEQEEIVVATFTQEARAGRHRLLIRKRQYWAHEDGGWKIVSETALRS